MQITPNNAGLGARVTGVDLGQALPAEGFRTLLRALGAHGVLCFPGQDLDAPQLAGFARLFGELEVNVANLFHAPGLPEIMILSNLRDAAGKPVGLSDAGQGWHTDMSYSHDIALANALHAKRIPLRDGRPLGDTQFRNMHAAYDDLPAEVVERLEGRADAQETPIGRLPTRASLDTSGLGLTDAQLTTLLSVDREVWHEEAATIPSGYERFGDRLPKALWDQYHALVARLAS